MSLYNKSSGSPSVAWGIRTADDRYPVSDAEFQSVISRMLRDVAMGYEQFVVLEPSAAVGEYSFIQACRDDATGQLHLEVGVSGRHSGGRPLLLARDAVSEAEAFALFDKYRREHTVNTRGWYTLR